MYENETIKVQLGSPLHLGGYRIAGSYSAGERLPDSLLRRPVPGSRLLHTDNPDCLLLDGYRPKGAGSNQERLPVYEKTGRKIILVHRAYRPEGGLRPSRPFYNTSIQPSSN